jgi:hypothetical protein
MRRLDRKSISQSLTILALLVIAGGAMLHSPRDTCTMAIALRDHVPADQRRISKAFTLPIIAVAYDHHAYFEADALDNKRRDVQLALVDAIDKRCVVDLYFLSNGNPNYARWVSELDRLPPLRLVYDTGAGDATQSDQWAAIGARAFVGHPGVNIAPAFYTFFLPGWVSGAKAKAAVDRANLMTFRVLRLARALGFADDDDVKQLWLGTEARVFGDPGVAYP